MTPEPKSVISKKALVSTTLAIWLVVCLAYELHRIAAFLALPPSGDLYAHDWGFQLFAFALFRFPIWLVGLLVILAVEFTLLKRRTPQT
ncbi:MAG: hypothetical protein QOJ05_609 [Verrucomicrobiota bacterium]|jgi:hypothetical protein